MREADMKCKVAAWSLSPCISPLPQLDTHEWIESYQQTSLTRHDEATIDAYTPRSTLCGAYLVEKADDVRGKALFALGYWAGCRVSDVPYLLMEHAHVGPKIGWLHVGHKGEKFRDIDLHWFRTLKRQAN